MSGFLGTIADMLPSRRAATSLGLCALLAAVTSSAEVRLTKQDADRFQTKLGQIVSYGNTPPARGAKARAIAVTDAEVNSYLRYHARDQIPVGIVDPVLNSLGDGRVGGRAVVDLDAVRKQKQRGWLDPLAYLTGRLPVTANGRLHTKDGVGRFELQSAEISGVTIPKGMLQELLSFYSRTPENPAGIDMDAPFELPSRIREIRVASGQATIVQ